MPLTDTKLKAMYGKKKKLTTQIPDRDGLVASCGLSGRISWVFRYRYAGSQKRLTFGSYPVLSLDEAREQILEYQRLLIKNIDPKHDIEEREITTIVDCAEAWGVKIKTLRQNSQILYNSHINKYFTIKRFPHDIKKARFEYWLAYFDAIEKETTRVNAGAVYKTINTMLKYCKSRNIIQESVFFNIDFNAVGSYSKRGERNLQLHEVGSVWNEISKTAATPAIKACAKLLIIFGARNAEIREAKRDEFDLDRAVWTLPAARSKTNKSVRRAIPDLAKSLIVSLGDTYGHKGFLIPGTHLNKCMTAHSLNRFIVRTWGRLHAVNKMDKFTPHDFRRTLSTRLSEKEVLPHITEKMLGHELGGIMAVYNKHDWIDEQAIAYSLWSSMILQAANDELSRII